MEEDDDDNNPPFITEINKIPVQDNFIALYNKDYISTMYNKVKLPVHILDSKM